MKTENCIVCLKPAEIYTGSLDEPGFNVQCGFCSLEHAENMNWEGTNRWIPDYGIKGGNHSTRDKFLLEKSTRPDFQKKFTDVDIEVIRKIGEALEASTPRLRQANLQVIADRYDLMVITKF